MIENKWPKKLLNLTPEQKAIKDDFMKYWHEVLPKKYGLIEHFNHTYPLKYSKKKGKILDIGAGIGEHISYENLDEIDEYYALEIRPKMASVISKNFPKVKVIVGDCQNRLDFSDNYFDRINAIHVLEHLPNLPMAINEVFRLLKPDGEFCVLIPCEGGLAYTFSRKISAERIFKKRYNMNYDFFIKSEHINMPDEIFEELKKKFVITHCSFFPLKIPLVFCNLVIGMILRPRK